MREAARRGPENCLWPSSKSAKMEAIFTLCWEFSVIAFRQQCTHGIFGDLSTVNREGGGGGGDLLYKHTGLDGLSPATVAVLFKRGIAPTARAPPPLA